MYTLENMMKQIEYLEEYEKKILAVMLISSTLNTKAIDDTIKRIKERNKKGML